MRHLSTIILIAVAILISSCSADMGHGLRGHHGTTFGVITAATSDDDVLFQIMTDDMGLFNVVQYDTPSYGVSKGARVYFDYEILDEDAPVAEVRIIGFNALVTKPLDVMSTADQDALGYDAIRCAASFGGDYINLNYEYISGDDAANHNISLVYDDTTLEDGYADLYLRHNANGDICDPTNGSSIKGIASFQITQLIPEGGNTLHVRLHWTWWNSEGELVELSDTGTFVPFNKSSLK